MPYLGNTAGNRFVTSKAATQFSGDGSNTSFTLEHSVGSDEDILVSVDGVIQEPSVAYAVSNGTTLTFTAAPSNNSGNNIFVYYLFRTVGTVSHPATNALQATSGTFNGNVTVTDDLTVDTSTLKVDSTNNRVGAGGVATPTTRLDLGGSNAISGLTLRSGDDNASSGGGKQIIFGFNGTNQYSHVIRTRHNSGTNDNNSIYLDVWSSSQNATDIGTRNVAIFDGVGNTFPNQPYFQCYGLTSGLAHNAVITGWTVQQNIGSHFNGSTGVFTAPVAGKYVFSGSIFTNRTTGTGDFYFDMQKNNGTFYRIYTAKNGSVSSHVQIEFSKAINLAANDTIRLKGEISPSSITIGTSGSHTNFQGFLLQ